MSFLKDPSPPRFSAALLVTRPHLLPSLCSFFGFYDENETVLEMEEQLVSPWNYFPFLCTSPPQSVAFPACCLTRELKGSSVGRGPGTPAGTHFVSHCVFLPCPFSHPKGLSAGFFWVEDSLGPGGDSEVSNGWDIPHSLAL